MKRHFILLLSVLALLALSGGTALANVCMDENFESTPFFVNRAWPIQDQSTTVGLTQGINLRAKSSDQVGRTITLAANTGARASDRKYTGTYSYKMVSGNELRITSQTVPSANADGMRVWQFAANTNSATCNLANNTIAAVFNIAWSTNGDNATSEHNTTLNFRVYNNGTTKRVDIVCANNGVTIGSLNGGTTDWRMITIVANQSTSANATWRSNNWVSGSGALRKGPQPTTEPPVSASQWRTLSTGIHFFVDSNTEATSYNPGGSWGGSNQGNTYEIAWNMKAQNSGTLYVDDLYWDVGLHSSMQEGDRLAREADARISNFGTTAAPGTNSITSNIKKIYVINSAHLDIGYTDTPAAVISSYQTQISDQLWRVDAFPPTPQMKMTVENTWQLQQWMATASAADKTKFFNYVKAGRISVTADHHTPHSSKLGSEEINRQLRNAADWRSAYGITVKTAMFDDVPGVSWMWPQTLKADGVKYFIAGENLFIGGGFTQPYNSYLFDWYGPDGSSIRTWATKLSYAEFQAYGFPFVDEGFIDRTKLQAGLTSMTAAGYPYDAMMMQCSFDNNYIPLLYDAVRYWNAYNTNPQIIIATPEDFFTYIEGKYSSFPTVTGDWTSPWDLGGPTGPQAEKVFKTWRSLGLTAEKAYSIVSRLGLGTYPASNFDYGWDRLVTLTDHSGPGAGEVGYYTQAETDENNNWWWQVAADAQSNIEPQYLDGLTRLTSATRVTANDTFSVFNPLSWSRSDVVRFDVPSAVYNSTFQLQEAGTGTVVKYQKYLDDATTQQIAFVASSVPGMGLKRYNLVAGTNPTNTTILMGANSIENDLYRVVVSTTNGYITSFYDKTAARELVATGRAYQFNQMLKATNSQFFFGASSAVTNPTAVTITQVASGPVMGVLKVALTNYPNVSYKIIMYDGVDRVDLVQRVDRTQMEYVNYAAGSLRYGFAFPFNLTSAIDRYDTGAGWLNFADSGDAVQSSTRNGYNPQNCLDLSEASYGITWASRDVLYHSMGDTKYNTHPTNNPTVVTIFDNKQDEGMLTGNTTGTVHVEASCPNQWDLRFTVKPHRSAFDPAREARSGYEVCQPLEARHVAAGGAGKITANTASFLSCDANNVFITSVKNASFGSYFIVKVSEIGETATTTYLRSDQAKFYNITEVTPTETDVTNLLNNSSGQTSWQFTIGAQKIRYFRIDLH